MEDKQPHPAVVIERQLGLFILNICFNKAAVAFCYSELTAVIRIDLCSAGRQPNQTWQMWARQCRCVLNQAHVIDPPWNPSWSGLIDRGLLLRLFLFWMARRLMDDEAKSSGTRLRFKSCGARTSVNFARLVLRRGRNVKMVPMAAVSFASRFSSSAQLEKWCHRSDGLQLIKPVLSLKRRTERDAAKQTCLISRAEREIILANACHLTAHFCSLHHSQPFILKHIDVRCQRFDSEVWCTFFSPSFLKAASSKWAEIFFYKSVPRRLKAKMAQHKLSGLIDWIALKYRVFETATFQYRAQQLHSQTWHWMELHYSRAAFIRM